MRAFQVGESIFYRPPGKGLHRKLPGKVLSLQGGQITVQPARGTALDIPANQVRPVRFRPIAPLVPSLPVPIARPLVVTMGKLRLDPAYLAIPPKHREDPAYLAWIRSLDCSICGMDQRTQTQVHHFGPRGVGQRTHDWFSSPLCALCHAQFHRWRTLPDLTGPAVPIFLLKDQVRLLLRYFASLLGPDADRWLALANLPLPLDQQAAHLRLVLELLANHLCLLVGVPR